jgi:ring-1,2-phenylacetyl-CoA epoxidase subunit PaaC
MSTTGKTDAATETMLSLVGSLADSKAALGRAYADWAVSAPTLESAVAAAAMAQDELGHARSTYPVLKAMGADDAQTDGGRGMAILDAGLPDWTSFIAANLLIDGVLATFVAACADSSLPQMSSRARKILQEEGSHRAHGEAWAHRVSLAGDEQRAALVSRLEEMWEHAGRWTGPDKDPGYAAALAEGLVTVAPAEQRCMVADWVTALLAADGAEPTLVTPTDWSGWDPTTRRWEP